MVREADEFSDDGMSVSSQQARRMEQLEELEKLRLARQQSSVQWHLHQSHFPKCTNAKIEELRGLKMQKLMAKLAQTDSDNFERGNGGRMMGKYPSFSQPTHTNGIANKTSFYVDDPLAGADVVDERAIMDEQVQNELLADGPPAAALNSGQKHQDELMPEEEGMAEDGEIIQEEEDEEQYSPMASKSRPPAMASTSSARSGPRKSLFCAPSDSMRKFKFQMHNAPSNGQLDFGGGMDLSLLSSASSSADATGGRMSIGGIAAEYATPVMGAAQAVRANSAERRRMAKPYIHIQQQQRQSAIDSTGNGITRGVPTTNSTLPTKNEQAIGLSAR